MKILILDDEIPAINNMKRVVSKVMPLAELTATHDPEDALDLCKNNSFDVAFLDVEMPGYNGLTLAKEIKRMIPNINIIVATAYSKYSLDAFKIYASGYILKPITYNDVYDVLNNLRNPINRALNGLYAQCFGYFEVFYDGEVINFQRTKSKEILAYLIDKKGSAVTNKDICAKIFDGSEENAEKNRNYFHHLYNDLQSTLEQYNCSDVLVKGFNSYAIDINKIECDYYKAIKNDPASLRNFQGEYMGQYSWAEFRQMPVENEMQM